ncbi:M60 family metallopeptidase [Lactococcus petauri]|uniref:M60 family metallopeptidase n=1 Tax=Lactococcus petauri TaxID=1940789 RepID=UPI003854CF91
MVVERRLNDTFNKICWTINKTLRAEAPTIKNTERQEIQEINQIVEVENKSEFYQFETLPQGDVLKRKEQEQRWFSHSNRQPTGLYTEGKENFTVISDREKLIPETTFVLQKGENNITYQKGIGMIYLTNLSENEISRIYISKKSVRQTPIFELGKTTQREFEEQLDLLSEAPFVELVGKYIYGTFKYSLAADTLPGTDIEGRIEYWDKGLEIQASLHGLDYNEMYNNRVYIANPDSGPKGMVAFAQDYHILMFGQSGQDLLSSQFNRYTNANRLLWHEVGHTFQNVHYKLEYLNEVTNEFYALVVQIEMGHGNNLKENYYAGIKHYLLQDDNVKDYSKDFLTYNRIPVGLFEQLRIEYGTEFYGQINQYYREYSDSEGWRNYDAMQNFIIVSSKVANRNLIPFFKKWGIRPTENVRNKLSSLPLLEKNIWLNIYS